MHIHVVCKFAKKLKKLGLELSVCTSLVPPATSLYSGTLAAKLHVL